MKKLWAFIKKIPWWAYIAGVGLFGLQFGIYRLAHVIADASGATNHVWSPKIPVIDNGIPLVPFFVIFYVLSYAFWIVSLIVVFRTEKRNYINFIFAYVLHLIVGAIVFASAPSFMDRSVEGIYETVKNGKDIFSKLLFIVYEGDGGTSAFNLFPSLHCSISFLCFLAIFNDKNFNLASKIVSLTLVILITLSTVFTKQHYFIDTIGGYALALISYFLIKFINPSRWFNLKDSNNK